MTGGLIVFYLLVFSVLFGEVPGATEGHPLFGVHLGIESLAHFADFMLLGGLAVVNFAIVQSRRKYPDVDRGFEVPAVPWVPAIAVLANLALLVNVEPKSLVIGLLAEGVGVAFWFLVLSGGPPAERIEEETPTLVAEHQPAETDYQIVVPIANPEHVEQLMRTADDVAADRGGEVLVMSVVDLPAQTPLSEGVEYADEKREVLDRAMDLADRAGVPVSGVVRIGHDVPAAILNTVEQYDADAVLMGWQGTERHRRDVVLGTTVDRVVREGPCDVLVERIGATTGDVDSVLLPTAGGPHAEYAAEASRAIARSEDATVRILHVVAPDADNAERRDATAKLDSTAADLGDVTHDTELVESDDVVGTIVDRTRDYDLTVIGATREGVLQRLVFGAVPEAVADRAAGTVIMAKRNLGITSRIRRWLRWE